jgi:hypothetical protein
MMAKSVEGDNMPVILRMCSRSLRHHDEQDLTMTPSTEAAGNHLQHKYALTIFIPSLIVSYFF